MKILVLCLDNSFGPWHEMYQGGTLKTWCNPSNPQIICRRFMGQDSRWPILNRIANRLLVSRSLYKYWHLLQSKKELTKVQVLEVNGVIRVDLPELWSNITLKTLAAMKFALDNYEFDFLLRANSTCYLDLASLRYYLSKNAESTLYAGPIAKGKEYEFAKKTKVQVEKNHINGIQSRGSIVMTQHGFIEDEKKAIDGYKDQYKGTWSGILGSMDFEVAVEAEVGEDIRDVLLTDD